MLQFAALIPIFTSVLYNSPGGKDSFNNSIRPLKIQVETARKLTYQTSTSYFEIIPREIKKPLET